MTFTQVFSFKIFTNPFCMILTLIFDILYIKIALKFLFFRQWCFIKLFPLIHIFISIYTFFSQKINLLISLLENLNVLLNGFSVLHHTCLSNLCCKKTFIFCCIVLDTLILKKIIITVIFNFVNFCCKIFEKSSQWNCYKSK